MARSSWKLPLVYKSFSTFNVENENLWKKIFKNYRIFFKRNYKIPFSLINKKVKIYNGKKFLSFVITSSMLGHKFGEFSITKLTGRKIALRKLDKAKKSKKKKK